MVQRSELSAYNREKNVKTDFIMRKMIGLVVFFIAIGMLLMIIVHNRLIGLIITSLLLFVGYNCFCDGW